MFVKYFKCVLKCCETEKLQFDKNRYTAKYFPCNKSNRDGKFVPLKGTGI